MQSLVKGEMIIWYFLKKPRKKLHFFAILQKTL